jgi:type VI secretion system protein ImpE
MNAGEHYRAGNLAEAVATATAAVKSQPQDVGSRGLLAELLCFAGDLERADKQLDALNQLDPQLTVGVALFRQLIRAAQARQQFFNEGRLPEFLQKPSPELELRLEASVRLRADEPRAAAELLAKADQAHVPITGVCDGADFDDLRDLDDLTASVLEVLTSTGKYYWVPLDQIELLELRAPQRPRDLLWRAAHLVVRGGPDGEVYIPVLYPGSAGAADDAIRLGRATDWIGGDGAPTRGLGQRIFWVGQTDRPFLEISTIETAARPQA